MKDTPADQLRDQMTLESARMLCSALEAGLTTGESPETVGEFLEVHAQALDQMRMRVGRGNLIIEVEALQRRWPVVPYEGDVI